MDPTGSRTTSPFKHGGGDQVVSDEEGVLIIIDPEATIKGLRELLDKFGIPHTCPQCGTVDPKDITRYCCPTVWKCNCGYKFLMKS